MQKSTVLIFIILFFGKIANALSPVCFAHVTKPMEPAQAALYSLFDGVFSENEMANVLKDTSTQEISAGELQAIAEYTHKRNTVADYLRPEYYQALQIAIQIAGKLDEQSFLRLMDRYFALFSVEATEPAQKVRAKTFAVDQNTYYTGILSYLGLGIKLQTAHEELLGIWSLTDTGKYWEQSGQQQMHQEQCLLGDF